MAPLKILVTGSAKGALGSYFKKLTAMQAKHQFDLCLALDLFSDVPNDSLELAQLLAGEIKSPVQIYCAVGGGVLPAKVLERVARGEEVADNVMMLGKQRSACWRSACELIWLHVLGHQLLLDWSR